ncbi:hypothetical protein B0J17DRAFT_629944 [Rhizoctonia solani]|nr:hypothetical protein B0J17DRAFT_629944 [Rhizoctonia solani]
MNKYQRPVLPIFVGAARSQIHSGWLRLVPAAQIGAWIAPDNHTVFNLDTTNYAINASLELYFLSGSTWRQEIFHDSPELAFGALIQLGSLEREWNQGLSIGTNSGKSHPACRGTVEPGPAGGETILPLFSTRPTKEEIDGWINAYKVERKLNLPSRPSEPSGYTITCPLRGCNAILARPSALKTHLYFRFGIKPDVHVVASLRMFSLFGLFFHECEPHTAYDQ